MTRFYVIRHAHSTSNRSGAVAGHNDVLLTEKGEEQAANLANSLKDIHFDKAFSSDLIRARRTAEILTANRALTLQTTKLLRERAYGNLEGEKTDEERKKIRQILKQYWRTPYKASYQTKIVEGMETSKELIERVLLFLTEKAHAHKGKNLLVVSHGDVIITLLSHLHHIKEDETGDILNTGYIILESDGVALQVKHTEGVWIIPNYE